MPYTGFYTSYPKVDLHRHLEGSLRISTLVEIARQHGIDPYGTDQLRALVQVGEKEPYTANNFLSKFATLRLFYRSPEVIERVTREAVADAANDNIRYLELRFTPVALSRVEDFPLAEVTDWVVTAAYQAGQDYGIKVGLIASVNRHESVELAEQVAQIAADRIKYGLVGIDLAGNEAEFSAHPFAGVFRAARQAGLHITIHAGEWSGADNVRQAIELLNAERIGHGIRIMEDPDVVALARDRGATFEVCITSNFQSGVVNTLETHPLPKMLKSGLKATINTDDPSISRITLSQEYEIARTRLGLDAETIQASMISAAESSFLPQDQRQQLIQSLRAELDR